MIKPYKKKSLAIETTNTAATELPPQSWASSQAVRRVMQRNKSRDTVPEIAVRSAVHAMGMRYRVSTRPLSELRRTADLVFRGSKVAVFTDGCFWHGCPTHHTSPKTNSGYWTAKIEGNRARDASTTELLTAAGWSVLRFWSHEEPKLVAARIAQVLHTRTRTAIPNTRTYAQLSRELGSEGAARAVGLANGRNPISIIIPCHRVIGSDGSLTGYAGGLARKQKLLELERVNT